MAMVVLAHCGAQVGMGRGVLEWRLLVVLCGVGAVAASRAFRVPPRRARRGTSSGRSYSSRAAWRRPDLGHRGLDLFLLAALRSAGLQKALSLLLDVWQPCYLGVSKRQRRTAKALSDSVLASSTATPSSVVTSSEVLSWCFLHTMKVLWVKTYFRFRMDGGGTMCVVFFLKTLL
jgi:hypothetical protein